MKKTDRWMLVFMAALALSCIVLAWQLIILNVLPAAIQTPVIAALALITVALLLMGYAFLGSKKGMTIMMVVTVGMTALYSTGAFYLYKTGHTLNVVTRLRDQNKNTVSVIVLNDAGIDSPDDLAGKKIGVLKSIDTAGTEKLIEALDKTGVAYEKIELDSVPQQASQLYNGQLDAIVLNEAYRSNITTMEDYEDFDAKTKVVFQTSFNTKTSNEPLAVSDVTSKPYNILISGNDTYGSVGELSRSDVNMVVTVDPLTSTVLLTSIPRDAYVPVQCAGATGCAQDEYDKITHTGINGITSTKETVEQLLGITINYTFRVNFSSVTDIVDSLGGIDVDVPEEAATDSFYADLSLAGVQPGLNHLEGVRALAFARERYAYVDGDNQRVRNQQLVLQAIFDKATSPNVISNYSSLLDALSSAFETNLTREEITSFIKYQIQSTPSWKFESYQLSGEGAELYCPSLGQAAYVTILDNYTVALAHDKIMATLDGQDPASITEPTTEVQPNPYTYYESGAQGADPEEVSE